MWKADSVKKMFGFLMFHGDTVLKNVCAHAEEPVHGIWEVYFKHKMAVLIGNGYAIFDFYAEAMHFT